MFFGKKNLLNILFILLAFISGSFFGLFFNNIFLSKYNLFKKISSNTKERYDKKALEKLDEKWAKKITNGGYILHIRHGMREKFTGSVTTYDAIELLNKDDARKTDYYRAVCLTERGILDSKIIGETFKLAKINISYVVSSPSCRARETAIFAFNRIDQIEPAILHRTAQIRSQHKDFANKLRTVMDNIPIKENTNVVISGHGGTLSYDLENKWGLVDIDETVDIDKRLETGIVVIEKVSGQYIARHKFDSIGNVAKHLLKLPIDNNGLNKFLFKPGDIYEPSNVRRGYIYNPNQ
tara:strand:- start:5927 stop:6811 length:885 start_codon:yes stop_codon:yes gene_type:complete